MPVVGLQPDRRAWGHRPGPVGLKSDEQCGHVAAACAEGRCGIYPIEDLDQAIELLTGVPAGEANEDGLVPEETLNYLVAAQLAALSALRQAFSAAGRPETETERADGGKRD